MNLKIDLIKKGEAKKVFPEIIDRDWVQAEPYGIVIIEDGTTDGTPAVMLLLQTAGGEWVHAQMTGNLFCTSAAIVQKACDSINKQGAH